MVDKAIRAWQDEHEVVSHSWLARHSSRVAESLDVASQEPPMEITPDCVIDEALLHFGFTACLIPEDNIIIPSPFDLHPTPKQASTLLCTSPVQRVCTTDSPMKANQNMMHAFNLQ